MPGKKRFRDALNQHVGDGDDQRTEDELAELEGGDQEGVEPDADGHTDGRGLESSDLIDEGGEGEQVESDGVSEDASALAAPAEGSKPLTKGEIKIQEMIARLRVKQEELTQRLAEKQAKAPRTATASSGAAAAKAAAEATDVPGMFPRQPTIARVWSLIQERKTTEGDQVKVQLSINGLTKELATNRSTVKGAFKALASKGILIDQTPELNAAHTYLVADPFANGAAPQVQATPDEGPHETVVNQDEAQHTEQRQAGYEGSDHAVRDSEQVFSF